MHRDAHGTHARAGMGIVKRLVEGLRLEYYQTMGVVDEVKSHHALLQLEGVTVLSGAADGDSKGASKDKDGKDHTPRAAAADAKAVAKATISLVLDPPVAVCAATAGLLQSLVRGTPEVRLPLMRTDQTIPLWDDLVLPDSHKKSKKSATAATEADHASPYAFVSAGRPTGGVEVSVC
jgi:hypothetical protein